MKISFITKKYTQGFTLLEMLFAVLIFSFALVSLTTIASKGVIATTTAKQQLTAQFLAEEALEVGRNVRDGNYLNGADWLTILGQCTETIPCDVDYTTNPLTPVLTTCNGGCGQRQLYDIQGVFRPEPNGGTPTTFWRTLVIKPAGTNNEKLMEATVHWKQKTVDRALTLTTHIANWQP